MKALQRLRRSTATLLMAGVLWTGVPCAAQAQMLPSEPLVFGDGRITLGGDVSATYSCADPDQAEDATCPDDTGFFNYTDYEHSALRMVRFDVTASIKASEHLSFLTEIRSENIGSPQPYGLYARIRPWSARAFDIQVGRVPPTFGAFARRTYPADNMLIGYPLAYQYLTSLRADSLPRDADELLRMRGRGWLSNYSVGNLSPDRGLALVSAFRWDTGIQLHAANEYVDGAVAVTTGTLGNPLVGDDNNGRQVAGRIALRPTPAWVIGVSLARGPYLTRDASESAGEGGRTGPFTQTGWGADVEYSRDYYLLRIETIVSDWRLPLVGTPAIDLPLRAVSTLVEGRYRIRPGIYAAARVDHLGFSEVVGSAARDSWDAPVTRIEVGGGFSLQRNLLLKLAVQRNSRSGGRVTRETVGSAQLVFWL